MTIPYRGMPPPIDDELLSAYLDGQVLPDERERVEVAIATDPAVRARVRDLRATVALLRALPQPAPRRTFILAPEQAAAIRPMRVPWLTRIFPTVAAVSAVAAVLCFMLIAGDLATGGFATKQVQPAPARPATESLSNATNPPATSAAAPTTAPAANVAPAPAAATTAPILTPPTTLASPAAAAAVGPAPAATTAAARSAISPPQAAAPVAPTTAAAAAVLPTSTGAPAPTGSFANSAAPQAATPTTVPLPTLTVVANAQPSSPVTGASSSGGAIVTKESHRVPVALVRVGEILLALLAVAGVTLALLGRRRKAAGA